MLTPEQRNNIVSESLIHRILVLESEAQEYQVKLVAETSEKYQLQERLTAYEDLERLWEAEKNKLLTENNKLVEDVTKLEKNYHDTLDQVSELISENSDLQQTNLELNSKLRKLYKTETSETVDS